MAATLMRIKAKMLLPLPEHRPRRRTRATRARNSCSA
jgi:chromatin segregation and condensation protein Rec8/ScpA/Scc1 (kleisin family)